MAKKRRPYKSTQTPQAAPVQKNLPKQIDPSTQAQVPQRAVTRAWAKKTATPLLDGIPSARIPRRRPAPPQPQPDSRQTSGSRRNRVPEPRLKKGGAANKSSDLKANAKQDGAPEKKDSHQSQREPGRPRKAVLGLGCLAVNPVVEQSNSPSIVNWLRDVDSSSPQDPFKAVTATVETINQLTGSMERSSSTSATTRTSRNSGVVPGDQSTTKETKSPKAVKVTLVKLRYRHVRKAATKDPRIPHFQPLLSLEPPKVPFEAVDLFLRFWEDLRSRATLHPKNDYYSDLVDFTDLFNQWKATANFAVATTRDIETEIRQCNDSNEHILQRTLMMSVIDHRQLKNMFVVNCEGQWRLPKEAMLYSIQEDEVTLPRPDLAIFFRYESFFSEGDDISIPSELNRSLCPDGAAHRCFPFFFMEVKRAKAELEAAFIANLHSASQALFNIYSWMARAGQEETFFQKVRVFTMVLNAQDLGVRIHRATPRPDGHLDYEFQEFFPTKPAENEIYPSARYSRDEACHLVKNILVGYGAEQLHAILREAIEAVSRLEIDLVQKKRKAANSRRSPSLKRLRTVQSSPGGAAAQPSIDPSTTSFGMSGLGPL